MLTEYRGGKFLEIVGEARVARPGLKFMRVECGRVHQVMLLPKQLQVDLRLLRGLLRDSKNSLPRGADRLPTDKS